jgi:redox-sensitive bicupin YhaK (pirin superfamily)
MRGALTLNGTELATGDGASTEDAGRLTLAASEPAEALLFDLA